MCLLSFAVAPDITARRAFSSSPKAGISCFFAETGALDSTHTRFEATNRPRKSKTSVEQPGVIPLGHCPNAIKKQRANHQAAPRLHILQLHVLADINATRTTVHDCIVKRQQVSLSQISSCGHGNA